MRGFVQRFDPRLWLHPFYKAGCILQECIGFSATNEERRHFQFWKSAPDVEILKTCPVDLRLPFGGVDQSVSAIALGCVIPSM